MKMTLKQNNKILLVWEDEKITYYDEKSKLLWECNNQRLFEYLLTRVGTRKDCLRRYDSMGVSEENALRVMHSINGPENIDDWKSLFIMASGRRMSDLIFLSVED